MSVLVLASASTSRARMLAHAGVDFEIVPASVDEEAVKDALLAEKRPVTDIADALAELKARTISTKRPGDLVLGADQILSIDGTLVSKCASLTEARALLTRLRGKRHELVSAAVIARGGAVLWRHVDRASLWMRSFSDEFLERYLAAGGEALLDGVGCYRVEEQGCQLFEKIEGDHFTILGLPLLPVLAALRELGILAK